jgi:DNA (cytosine-5)-methyltransferase 1
MSNRLQSGFKFVDLFAGIGGFHLALSDLGGVCVFASEIDEKARSLYELNFKDKDHLQGPIVGDIIPLTEPKVSKLIPNHDILTAGFPCQPFSKSGLQKGINETRGTLFYNIATILEARQPKYILLENVRNLIGPRHVDTWAKIRITLRDLGYWISDTPTIFSPHLLPPNRGGAPQVRDRIYIVGKYVGKDMAWAMADSTFSVPYAPVDGWDAKKWNIEKHLLLKDRELADERLTLKVGPTRERAIEIWEDFLKSIPPVAEGRRLPGFPIWEWALVQKPEIDKGMPSWKVDFLDKNAAFYRMHKKSVDAWRKRNPDLAALQTSYRKLEWQAGALDSIYKAAIQFRPSGIRVKQANYLPALVAMNQTSVVGSRLRQISVREAARLQSFPEDYRFGEQKASQSYKQLGNAVSTSAVKYVLTQHLEYFDVLDREIVRLKRTGG